MPRSPACRRPPAATEVGRRGRTRGRSLLKSAPAPPPAPSADPRSSSPGLPASSLPPQPAWLLDQITMRTPSPSSVDGGRMSAPSHTIAPICDASTFLIMEVKQVVTCNCEPFFLPSAVRVRPQPLVLLPRAAAPRPPHARLAMRQVLRPSCPRPSACGIQRLNYWVFGCSLEWAH